MGNRSQRRVVITGVGAVTPLGLDARTLVQSLRDGVSGIRLLARLPQGALGVDAGAEAMEFTGDISNYGALDKKLQRTIRKGTKMMCREIEMGVAASQMAVIDADLSEDKRDRDRTGVTFGCDYIMSMPIELAEGIRRCLDEHGEFQFAKWGSQGLSEVNPLWLLKYLPNMPASHVAIYNDLRGANNTLTLREASPGAVVAEAYSTITRGHADVLLAGATGSRIHDIRSLHASLQEPLASNRDDPTTMSRPFDQTRDGSVLGEGAATIVCEDLQHAQNRNATILGEIVGFGSSAVGPRSGSDFMKQALVNVLRGALGDADPKSIGHIHAHGLATIDSDHQEAAAIAEVFGDPSQQPPVTTIKGHVGNLGAGGGMVEIIASLLALDGTLFPVRNCDQPDPACPVNICRGDKIPAGSSFISANVTPQGQASAVRIQRFES